MMKGISPSKSFGCFYIPLLLMPLEVPDRVLFLNTSFRLAKMTKGVDAVEFVSGLCNAQEFRCSGVDNVLLCFKGLKKL